MPFLVSALGTIVFGRRLGCVAQPGKSSEMEKFVYYVQKIFGESAKMSLFSPHLAAKLRLPVWRRFEEAADNALSIGKNKEFFKYCLKRNENKSFMRLIILLLFSSN